jgi:dTDP-4-amino-4,6-dideoxygalactose transaminase
MRPFIDGGELTEVRKVLSSNWLAQGPKVEELEKKISSYVGAKHVVATSSCTTALSLALESLDIKQGNEVIVPDFTFPATGNVVVRHGAIPVLVDVTLDTFSIDVAKLKQTISKKTRAIIPMHPFGQPAELDEIYEIASAFNLEVIEDAATAFGAEYKGKRIGGTGRIACFSFHPRKLLTTGEGGCLATDDPSVAARARALRNHGQVNARGKTMFLYNGLNYRMSDVHAAIGVAQLSKFDFILERRRNQAMLYEKLLGESKLDIHPQSSREYAFHTYQSYVVRLGRGYIRIRDQCIKQMLRVHNIETQIGTYSMHLQRGFSGIKRADNLKNSTTLYNRTLTLPLFHKMTQSQQKYVIAALKAISEN